MPNNNKKKGFSWFKDNSDQSDLIIDNVEQDEVNEEDQTSNLKEQEQLERQNNKNLFSKNNQDKVVQDLIISMENIIKDRQLILYRNKGITEQLHVANKAISHIKQDSMKKDQLLKEKDDQIHVLENGLTNKQMSYDQLLEDYKEFQNKANVDYLKISNQLETEIIKYNKLYEESMEIQYKNISKISELEEVIRNLEIENQRYALQYKIISDEKLELMQTINDFTERMSFSFSPKTRTSSSSDSK